MGTPLVLSPKSDWLIAILLHVKEGEDCLHFSSSLLTMQARERK